MHRHQLHRLLALAGLMFAGLQRGMGEEGGERAAFADGAFVIDEGGGGVDQFVEVFQPLLAFLLDPVVLGRPDFSMMCSTISGSGSFCGFLRNVSIRRMKAPTVWPALPVSEAAAL
jgi:hypothetical protein